MVTLQDPPIPPAAMTVLNSHPSRSSRPAGLPSLPQQSPCRTPIPPTAVALQDSHPAHSSHPAGLPSLPQQSPCRTPIPPTAVTLLDSHPSHSSHPAGLPSLPQQSPCRTPIPPTAVTLQDSHPSHSSRPAGLPSLPQQSPCRTPIPPALSATGFGVSHEILTSCVHQNKSREMALGCIRGWWRLDFFCLASFLSEAMRRLSCREQMFGANSFTKRCTDTHCLKGFHVEFSHQAPTPYLQRGGGSALQ